MPSLHQYDCAKFPAHPVFQVCSMQMESYGASTEDLIFRWAPEDPVQIAEDGVYPEYILVDMRTSICTKVYSTGENFSEELFSPHFNDLCSNY